MEIFLVNLNKIFFNNLKFFPNKEFYIGDLLASNPYLISDDYIDDINDTQFYISEEEKK